MLKDGKLVRKQRSAKLAEVCERFHTESDVRPLLVEKLRPINEGRTSPESTLSVSDFVEKHYLPFVEENYKPSTLAGYKSTWEMYLAGRLEKVILRDFRTVNAATLLADIHRTHGLGRVTLNHVKTLLSGIFTYAKNLGALDGVNPIRDAMIPKKAAAAPETHAATLEEVLAIMHVLERAGEQKARAAVALMFFTGLRPGEARGACWQDFDGKKLSVRQSVWHTYTTTPKTKGSAKPVPVIEPLASILVELRQKDGNPLSGPILRGAKGKPLDLHNLASRVVRPTLRRCAFCDESESDHNRGDHEFRLNEALPKWHGWYALRRGVATAVTALSKDSLAAKGLLRHSSISTTQRHYIKDVPETTLHAMKLLETLCNESAKDGKA